MAVQPYLFFDGRAEEALEFYKTALGAEGGALMRFKDMPAGNSPPPAPPDKIMHASFRLAGTEVLVSDGRCLGQPSFQGFALSLTMPTPAEAERLFGKIAAAGGTVQMAMAKTFFSPAFGMVADRFGVTWMIHVA